MVTKWKYHHWNISVEKKNRNEMFKPISVWNVGVFDDRKKYQTKSSSNNFPWYVETVNKRKKENYNGKASTLMLLIWTKWKYLWPFYTDCEAYWYKHTQPICFHFLTQISTFFFIFFNLQWIKILVMKTFLFYFPFFFCYAKFKSE